MHRTLPALVLLLSILGCDKKTTNPVVVSDVDFAAALWQRMTIERYTVSGAEWRMYPGKTGIYGPDTSLLGADPHLGPTHFRTYANAAAHDAIVADAYPMPDASIIAKQNFVTSGADTSLDAITVMFKRAGYDVEHGDWFWAKYKPNGQVEVAGRVTMCSGCHQGASMRYGTERDYVWTRR